MIGSSGSTRLKFSKANRFDGGQGTSQWMWAVQDSLGSHFGDPCPDLGLEVPPEDGSCLTSPGKQRHLVMLPSGDVLFGMTVQQNVPNILHTPPFLGGNMSKAIAFCHAVSDVGPNFSAMV